MWSQFHRAANTFATPMAMAQRWFRLKTRWSDRPEPQREHAATHCIKDSFRLGYQGSTLPSYQGMHGGRRTTVETLQSLSQRACATFEFQREQLPI